MHFAGEGNGKETITYLSYFFQLYTYTYIRKAIFGNNRREKSLALLTQNFVKLFILSNQMELITQDDAAKLLLWDAHNSSIMRTKVRRLNDIANVLSSMKFIEKTHTTNSRKPTFRWLGLKENQNSNVSISRKRAVGTEITNIGFKRNKVDGFMNEDFG
ncbi:hypothetical protein RIF29_15768 [Crotalaria pallida]|uniref:E2F/DP family winged-helix DNA-binding domain-containing protein n=1 Tax=Crotalaria pallida TaxID=3830 RepID=A0AAN9FG22_CROPI